MWLNLIPEHDVLGTAPSAASESGVQDPCAGEAPRAQGLRGTAAGRAQGPLSPLGVLAMGGSQLLMTTRGAGGQSDSRGATTMADSAPWNSVFKIH